MQQQNQPSQEQQALAYLVQVVNDYASSLKPAAATAVNQLSQGAIDILAKAIEPAQDLPTDGTE